MPGRQSGQPESPRRSAPNRPGCHDPVPGRPRSPRSGCCVHHHPPHHAPCRPPGLPSPPGRRRADPLKRHALWLLSPDQSRPRHPRAHHPPHHDPSPRHPIPTRFVHPWPHHLRPRAPSPCPSGPDRFSTKTHPQFEPAATTGMISSVPKPSRPASGRADRHLDWRASDDRTAGRGNAPHPSRGAGRCSRFIPATTYSPRGLPPKYHRRRRA